MSPELDRRRAIIVVAVAFPELGRILYNWEISQAVFKKRLSALGFSLLSGRQKNTVLKKMWNGVADGIRTHDPRHHKPML
jgi:hypothetical protein